MCGASSRHTAKRRCGGDQPGFVPSLRGRWIAAVSSSNWSALVRDRISARALPQVLVERGA